jgi:beta-phosphoglucomutase
MTYKACLFDLDGVLVDTAIYHFQAWKSIASSFGYILTEEQNEKLKGVSRVESLNRILNWANYTASSEQKDTWLLEKNKIYLELISHMDASEILPGVLDFLVQLKASSYKIALGSASKNAEIILEKTGLFTWFDVIIDGNKVSNSKPNPEVFLKGALGLHVNPTECIVFEDAQAGIEAAKAANMRTIGIGDKQMLGLADKVIPGFVGINAAELLDF